MSFRSGHTEGSDSAKNAVHQVLPDDVKEEWRLLWRNRIDDKVRAEGIADRDFSLLFVDRGTVIVATRDFKPLDLRDILHLHDIQNVERIVLPSSFVGGWGKFARTVLNKQKRARRWHESVPCRNGKKKLQLKKGGRGWLHYNL